MSTVEQLTGKAGGRYVVPILRVRKEDGEEDCRKAVKALHDMGVSAFCAEFPDASSGKDGESEQVCRSALGEEARKRGMELLPEPPAGETVCSTLGDGGWKEGVREDRMRIDRALLEGSRYFALHTFSCGERQEGGGIGGKLRGLFARSGKGPGSSGKGAAAARPADGSEAVCWIAQGNHPQTRHYAALMACANRLCALLDGMKTAAQTPVPDPIADGLRAVLFEEGACRPAAAGEEKSGESDASPSTTVRGKREIIFLLNEGQEDWKGHLPAGSGDRLIYNAWEDRLERPASDEAGLRLSVPAGGSLVLVAGMETEGLTVFDPLPRPTDCLALMEGRACEGAALAGAMQTLHELTHFKRSTCRAADYPDFSGEEEIKEMFSYGQVDPKFSGFVRYETGISVPERVLASESGRKKDAPEKGSPEEGGTGNDPAAGNGFANGGGSGNGIRRPDPGPAPGNVILEVTEAWEGVEVFVNGESAGLQVTAPFVFDLTPLCRPGSNRLAIETASTLERERCGKKNAAPTGITGRVYLYIRNRL